MGIFNNIGNVKAGGSNARGEYFRDGRYVVTIHRCITKNRREDDQPIAIVEGYVKEVLVGQENSHAVGAKVAWFNKLSTKRNGELTDQGKMGMERIKGFLAEALGGAANGVSDEDITEEVAERVFSEPGEDGQPGTGLQGLTMIAEARTKTSQKSGKAYTNVYWNAITQPEEAEGE